MVERERGVYNYVICLSATYGKVYGKHTWEDFSPYCHTLVLPRVDFALHVMMSKRGSHSPRVEVWRVTGTFFQGTALSPLSLISHVTSCQLL
jgi:hypothetical protein